MENVYADFNAAEETFVLRSVGKTIGNVCFGFTFYTFMAKYCKKNISYKDFKTQPYFCGVRNDFFQFTLLQMGIIK